MTAPSRAYFEFYLMGRDEAQDDGSELDIDYVALGQRVLGGENVRDVALRASKLHCKDMFLDGKMMEWRKSSRKTRREIDDAGGDTSKAYNLYVTGFIDEIATEIEREILTAIADADLDDVEADDDDEEDEDGNVSPETIRSALVSAGITIPTGAIINGRYITGTDDWYVETSDGWFWWDARSRKWRSSEMGPTQ